MSAGIEVKDLAPVTPLSTDHALMTREGFSPNPIGALNEWPLSNPMIAALSGKQDTDALLTSFLGLTGAADKMVYFTAPTTLATATLSSAARSLLDDADIPAMLATLGLENVDNVADADKPISSLVSAALALKADGADLTAHLADADNPHGVDAADLNLENVNNTSDANKPISILQQAALDGKVDDATLDAHVSATGNVHLLAKADIGLGAVDNTSDINKPVSNATSAALATKLNITTFDTHTAEAHPTAAQLAKLDGIEDNATADQDGAGIKVLYEGEANTNAFTDSLLAKLLAIDAAHYGAPLQDTTALEAIDEADITDKERRYVEDELSDYFYDATAVSGDHAPHDQTGGTGFWRKVQSSGESAASIKTKYESNADTNVFDDAAQSKLSAIEPLADVTDATNVTAAGALMDSEVDANLKTFGVPANTTISAFGATLIDDLDAGAAQATLGLDAQMAAVQVSPGAITMDRLLEIVYAAASLRLTDSAGSDDEKTWEIKADNGKLRIAPLDDLGIDGGYAMEAVMAGGNYDSVWFANGAIRAGAFDIMFSLPLRPNGGSIDLGLTDQRWRDLYLNGKIASEGDVSLELGDDAGANSLLIKDSAGDTHAAIDSDGNLTLSGNVDGRDVAADGTALDALVAKGLASTVEGTPVTVLAGVIKPNSVGTWDLITTSNHTPLGIASVSQDSTGITLTYDETTPEVGAILAGADETLTGIFSFGASVSLDSCYIKIRRVAALGGYVYYNGSSWVILNGLGITTAVFSSNRLQVAFKTGWAGNAGLMAQVNCRAGGGLIAQLDSTGSDTIDIRFYDFSGTLQTAASTDMKVRICVPPDGSVIDPADINSVDFSTGNAWVLGVNESPAPAEFLLDAAGNQVLDAAGNPVLA